MKILIIFRLLLLVASCASSSPLTPSASSAMESLSSASKNAVSSQPKGHILFFMPLCTQSAKITFMPVAERLVQLGHKVTLVTPYHSDVKIDGEYYDVVINSDYIRQRLKEHSDNMWTETSIVDKLKLAVHWWTSKIVPSEEVLSLLEVQKVLSEKVDLVVTMPMGNEIAYFLAYKLNATMVIWSSQQNPFSIYDYAIGQPHNPAYIGNLFTTYRHPMTFTERVKNSLVTYLVQFIRDYLYLPDFENVIDKFYPDHPRETRPTLKELELKSALVLQFGHPLIMDGIRPMAPNFVNVGMMNCRPGRKLPDHLQKFMDESGDDGVIFVSFGSVLKASNMAPEHKKILVDVFTRLKQRVIWKWETEEMEDRPDNVLLSKWLPQQDILAHPKLKLFVSHGGQSSCQESLCYKKPMVIVPVFADQPANAKEAELKGYGIGVPLETITEEKLYEAIHKVLTDPKYSLRAQEHGTLLMDDITNPLDRAIWWLEYALRHPGVEHLRSPVHSLAWYQYLLLDVIAFLLLIVLSFAVAFYWICRRICCSKAGKTIKEKRH